MKIKKISSNTYEIFDDTKSLGKITKYDIERLFASQIGSSLVFY